jgi:hypothetical protein
MIAPACVIDCSAQVAQDPDFLTVPLAEVWEAKHGRILERQWENGAGSPLHAIALIS